MTRTRINPRNTRTTTSGGLLSRAVAAMMGARERQAQHMLTMHLLAHDDDQLAALGYDRRSLTEDGPQSPF